MLNLSEPRFCHLRTRVGSCRIPELLTLYRSTQNGKGAALALTPVSFHLCCDHPDQAFEHQDSEQLPRHDFEDMVLIVSICLLGLRDKNHPIFTLTEMLQLSQGPKNRHPRRNQGGFGNSKESQLAERSCPHCSVTPPPCFLHLWNVIENYPSTVKSRSKMSLLRDKLHLPSPPHKGKEPSVPFKPLFKPKTPGLCPSRVLCSDLCITVTKHLRETTFEGWIAFILLSKALSTTEKISVKFLMAALSMMAAVV